MAERDPEVQALLDKKAIEETLLLFLRGCDRADVALSSAPTGPTAGRITAAPSTARRPSGWPWSRSACPRPD
jgi:hypothetical protein